LYVQLLLWIKNIVITINIFETGGIRKYRELTDELNLDKNTLSVPLLIIDKTIMSGF